jgi:hypothetical protein
VEDVQVPLVDQLADERRLADSRIAR